MIDIKKLNEAIGSSGWMLEGTDIDTNGFNSRLTIRLYGNRQKQGVKFEFDYESNALEPKFCSFIGRKEWYREVPQEVSGTEHARAEPHAAERALWKAQRKAGTNEIWQEIYEIGTVITTYPVDKEPAWDPNFTYRVKPMKLTARICRNDNMTFWQFGDRVQDWEFTGTREEYRAECEKYGYVVVSEIKEVKPKTVKYYFALGVRGGVTIARSDEDRERLIKRFKASALTIIGDIEEREIKA